ncbi:MAG: DUF4097 family beta strand repeat-containing protein [Myxococcota bacterium]
MRRFTVGGWVAMLASGLLASGCVVVRHVDDASQSFGEPVTAVAADLGSGDLSVTVGAVDQVTVAIHREWSGDEPFVATYVEGGTLHLEVQCRPGQLTCRVDYDVVLPAAATIDAELGSGDVTIDGLSGRVAVETGSGDVTLRLVDGDVIASTGSGDLEVDGVTGSLDAETGSGDLVVTGADVSTVIASAGSGDIELHVDAVTDAIAVDTGSGDVLVVVPTAEYRLSTDTGSGDVSLDGITPSGNAEVSIDVSTGSGDIRIVGS